MKQKRGKKRNREREREKVWGGGEMLDAPIRVPISVVVAEEVVLSCCLVAGYLQRLVDRREQVFTQTRNLCKGSHVHTLNIKPSHTKQVLQKERFMALSRTKSIKSERFFSMSCGGRRLMRSRAQSSCCSWLACNGVW